MLTGTAEALGLGGMWSAHLGGLTLFKFLDLGLVSKAFATPLSLWTRQTLDKSPSEAVLDWSIWPPHLSVPVDASSALPPLVTTKSGSGGRISH